MTEKPEPADQGSFPGLSPEAIARIEAGLNKNFGTTAPKISTADWQKLKPILAGYRDEAKYLRGFLNKGDASQMARLSSRAEKLRKDIETARDAGLSLLVESAIRPLPLEWVEAALEAFARELSIEPRDKPFKDTSRETLYANFELWWRRATGERPSIEEGSAGAPPPTPFMYVANEVFSLPGMPPPTGASYKSLKDFRRDSRSRAQKARKLGEQLKKLFPDEDISAGDSRS